MLEITEIFVPTEQWSLLRKCTLLFFLFKRVFRYYTYICIHAYAQCFARRMAGCGHRVFDKFNSAEFRENNDEVYYVLRSRTAEFRGVIATCIYMYAYMSRAFARDIFVLMQLLFGNKTLVKPDVQRINHMTRNVFLGERTLFRSATRPIIRRQVSRFCLAISYADEGKRMRRIHFTSVSSFRFVSSFQFVKLIAPRVI